MTEASLLNGSTNYPINGKKRIKRRLKRKDIDPETSNVRRFIYIYILICDLN